MILNYVGKSLKMVEGVTQGCIYITVIPTVDFYLENLYSDGGVNVLAELSYEELLSLHNTTKEMLNIMNEK